eukprot:GHRR01000309.1.p1 GENE.GHRR01000309.1~~GHRR01000309.1.p1  ORF type:complete len:945 (+),score=429.08 GHRR01000309.1:255-3089(+)
MLELGMSIEMDPWVGGGSLDLDAPAFPLNFDPSLLLGDVHDISDPDFDISAIIGNELDLDSPHAADLLHSSSGSMASAGSNTAPHGDTPDLNSGQQIPAGMQQKPGIFELFQVHNLSSQGKPLGGFFDEPAQQYTQPLVPQLPQQLNAFTTLQQQQQPAAQPIQQQQQQHYLQPFHAAASMQQQQQQQLQPLSPQQYAAPAASQLQVTWQQQNAQLTDLSGAPGNFSASVGMQPGYMQSTGFAATSMAPMVAPLSAPLLNGNHASAPVAAPVAAPATTGMTLSSFSVQIGSSPYMAAPTPLASDSTARQSAAHAAPSRRGSGGKKGRSKSDAATFPGMDKPMAPSRRFRERQKETISNLEAEVIQKLAQLQALSAENEMLKLRSAVLEATVKGRECHIEIIKEHGPPVFDAQEHTHGHGHKVKHPKTSSPASSGNGSQQRTSSSGLGDALEKAGSGGIAEVQASVVSMAVKSKPAGSEHSLNSCCTGAVCTAAASGYGSSLTAAATAATTAATTAAAAAIAAAQEQPVSSAADESDDDNEPLMKCCGDGTPASCTKAQQKKTISKLKHMDVEHILKHWRQFLHDITDELLNAEREEEIGNLMKTAIAAESGASCQDDTSSSCGAAAAMTIGYDKEEGVAMCKKEDNADCDVCRPLPVPVGFLTGDGCSTQAPLYSKPCTVSESRIIALVARYSYMTKYVALLNPGALYHLYGRHLDTGLPAPYSDDHWRQVVSRLNLTKSQVTGILACAELYFTSVGKLLDERRSLQQQLKMADEGLSECQKRLLGVDGGLNQLQVLDALVSNLKREHVLRIMLNCFVWGRTLNSIQFAKAAVYSHPFFPDVHAMVCVLYEDARAMAPNGQPVLVFPHRQGSGGSSQTGQPATLQQQQQLPLGMHGAVPMDGLAFSLQLQQQQQKMVPAAVQPVMQPSFTFGAGEGMPWRLGAL